MDIVKDFSQQTLTQAIAANMLERSIAQGQCKDVELYKEDGLTWIVSGLPIAFSNQVCDTQINEENADTVIEKTINFFREKNLPFGWLLGPTTTPQNLGGYLLKHGIGYEGETPGMSFDLSKLDSECAMPDGLKLVRISNRDELDLFTEASMRGFATPFDIREYIIKTSLDLIFDPETGWSNYIGLIDGEAVATTSMFLGGGVAGIYGVATIPEMRHRGIGKAMTMAPLYEAMELGYRVGILRAAPEAATFYRKFGWKDQCAFSNYAWRPNDLEP